ncbi:MAG: hypothetical protein DCC75_10135 [Proteobacteria bacterium]|nr:MAG: hypothetical protein DCC75_10135 [Pseudomonadota bacterium]
MAAACRVAREDHPGKEASAFVEDSVLLGGAPQYISSLACRLEHFPLPIRFGAQLTIAQILSRKDLVTRLRKSGLSYLFVGLETLEPSSIGGMSKDLGSKLHSWRKRAEEVFEFLSAINVRCGVALLFGLGESHYARITLLDHLQGWQRSFGIPAPISANWAVQHPLKGHDGGANYRYLDWGVPDGPFLEPFQEFGEASIKYPISGQPAPKLEEVLEIAAALRQLRTVSESRKVLEAAA